MTDGTTQVEFSADPLHYKDSEGVWRNIDTRVTPDDGEDDFVAEKNNFKARFGKSSSRLLRFEADGSSITLGAAGPTSKLAPSAEGPTVTFRDVFGGADVRYAVSATGVKEDIVLDTPADIASSYRFELTVGGLTARQLDDGSIGFFKKASDEQPRYVMPAPFMYDSTFRGLADSGWSDKVTQTVTQRGGKAFITIDPDQAWLTDAGREFPVNIDPTITIVPAPSDAQDTTINAGATTTNYGSYQFLPVGRTTGTTTWRSLLRFAIDPAVIPANTTIRSADLQLHFSRIHTSEANAVPIEAREVTQTWQETTATWQNMSASYNTTSAGLPTTTFQVDDTDEDLRTYSGPWYDAANVNAIGGSMSATGPLTTLDSFVWNARIPSAANYLVEAHYVPYSTRGVPKYDVTGPIKGATTGTTTTTTNVDQTTGSTSGVWKPIATSQYFTPGRVAQVKMTRQNTATATSPVADAIRWTTTATQTKESNQRDAWHSFVVTSLVQKWLNGTSNNGFMLKAANDTTGPVGGPYYEASEDAFGGETANRPRLVITYAEPGVTLNAPTVIHSDGPELTWSNYLDPNSSLDTDDVVEYEIYRRCRTLPGGCTAPQGDYYSTAQGTGIERVATVPASTTSWTDQSATPSSATVTASYNYWVVARTRQDQADNVQGRAASNAQAATIPREGRIVRVITGNTAVDDTTLSSSTAYQNTPLTTPDAPGRWWLQAGNAHATYGDERAILHFDTSPIKDRVKVTAAHLELWASGAGNCSGCPGATFDLHALSAPFTEDEATWYRSSSTVTWTTPGGTYNPAVLASLSGLTADDRRLSFPATGSDQNPFRGQVQAWVNDRTKNYGLLLKAHDETVSQQWVNIVNSESPDTLFTPKLYVEHLVKNDSETFEADQIPERFYPGTSVTVPVRVTNTTDTAWPAGLELSYRWTLPGDQVDQTLQRNKVPLLAALQPGESVPLQLRIDPPINSDTGASRRLAYDLYLDLLNGADWFSVTNPYTTDTTPPDQGCDIHKTSTGDQRGGLLCVNRYVESATSNMLGLEKFLSYAGEETGAGSQLLTNLYTGNMVWSWDAIANPSLGPSAFVRIAYNSGDTPDVGAGSGFSVQAATLTRLGEVLNRDTANRASFVDGDGTTHTYKIDTESPDLDTYTRPAGIPLKLKHYKTGSNIGWVLSRPDGTRFYFNEAAGRPSKVVDHNGNTMTYDYNDPTEALTQNDPAKLRRLTGVLDGQGRTVLTLKWNAAGLVAITDISGRTLKFSYSTSHQLTKLEDGGAVDANLNYLDPTKTRAFGFVYNAQNVSENTKLIKITDPRGHATDIAYKPATGNDWRKNYVDYYIDRRGSRTDFAYSDPDEPTPNLETRQIEATVTDQNAADGPSITTYTMDGFGRTTRIKDANANAGQTSDVILLGWDRDHNVIRLEEPNHAVSTWRFHPDTGYPVAVRDAQAVADGTPPTELGYSDIALTDGVMTVLATKVSPQGRKAVFGYDAKGNLKKLTTNLGKDDLVTDPDAQTTLYDYDPTTSVLTKATDPLGHATIYGDYDQNGYPKLITDARGKITRFDYDARGNVKSVIDPLTRETTVKYDVFGRPIVMTTPHDGTDLRSTMTTYDENDNVKVQQAANLAQTINTYGNGDELLTSQLPDNGSGATRTIGYSYDPLGRLKAQTAPLGVLSTSDPDDYVTRYTYDFIGQTKTIDTPFRDSGGVLRHPTVAYDYDNVGNVTKITDPKTISTTAGYYLDHQLKSRTDALGFSTRYEYDLDGQVTGQIDAVGNKKTTAYDDSGRVISVKVPHTGTNEEPGVRETTFEYDDAGNQQVVQVVGGMRTLTEFNENNQVSLRVAGDGSPTPIRTKFEYDDAGQLWKQSDPYSTATPTDWTVFDYHPSGDIKKSTDPWGISTSYTYNKLGQQLTRTLSNGVDDTTRSMSWGYNDDGSLKTRADTASKVQDLVVDNSMSGEATINPAWTTVASSNANTEGTNYRTHAAAAAGTAAANESARWTFDVPVSGTYQIYASCPVRTDTTTSAKYDVTHASGTATPTLNQHACTTANKWESLGTYTYTAGSLKSVTLKPSTSGLVIADAIKVVPASLPAAKTKSYTYGYDANGQQIQVDDASTDALTKRYKTRYDGLGRSDLVSELPGTTPADELNPVRTTAYTYDLNSNPTSVYANRPAGTDNAAVSRYTTYDWDDRNLVKSVTFGETPSSTLKTVNYTYDPRGLRKTMTKPAPGSNVTTYTYHEDGLLRTMVERLSVANGSGIVSSHSLWYDANGDRSREVSKIDDAGAAGFLDQTSEYTYSPTRRLVGVVKSGPDAGDDETYSYDAAGNTKTQKFGSNSQITMNYDRNRLVSSTQGTTNATYRYDSLGRLMTIATGGEVTQRYLYDGFDRVIRDKRYDTTGTVISNKAPQYDALDRTTKYWQQIKTEPSTWTRFTYLGMSEQAAAEEQTNTAGDFEVSKAYTYGPGGEKIALVDTPVNLTTTKTHYYSTNPHSDIEALTDPTTGQTTSTYRYTAYGSTDEEGTTGADKIEHDDVKDADIVNPYRFNGKRFDGATGNYDMGFRDYSPGLNRFLTRDMYNGALSDMSVGSDPWNTNRYAFAGANPISGVELDGHRCVLAGEETPCPSSTPVPDPAPYRVHTSVDDSGDEQVALVQNQDYVDRFGWDEDEPEIIGTVCQHNVSSTLAGNTNTWGTKCASSGPTGFASALQGVRSKNLSPNVSRGLLLAAGTAAYHEWTFTVAAQRTSHAVSRSQLSRLSRSMKVAGRVVAALDFAVNAYNNISNDELSSGEKAFNIGGYGAAGLAGGGVTASLMCGPGAPGCLIFSGILGSALGGVAFDRYGAIEPDAGPGYQQPTSQCQPRVLLNANEPWNNALNSLYCGR